MDTVPARGVCQGALAFNVVEVAADLAGCQLEPQLMQDQVRILAGAVPLYAHVECALIVSEVPKGSDGCPHCQEFEQVDLGSPPLQLLHQAVRDHTLAKGDLLRWTVHQDSPNSSLSFGISI